MSRRKKSKIKVNMILLIAILSLISVSIYFIITKDTKILKEEKLDTSLYYNEFVKTNKETNLYIKENDEYKIAGKIGNNIELSLNEISDTEDPYFNIKDLDEKYYINYKDVQKINELSEIDQRYKEYIVFNSNAVTKNTTTFYDKDENLVYSLKEELSLPIIIKEDEMYGVEFEDRLLYIRKDESEIIDNHNTDKTNTSGVGVLNYHFFYDETDPEQKRNCTEEICVSKSQFTRELDFLDENNIITVKASELEDYIDGKIQLPKSVYITIDDGGRNDVGLELLTERKEYATVFLITSWYDPSTYYQSEYIELHSHGDDIHGQYRCNMGNQGGAILCEDKTTLIADLKLSSEKLGGSTVFAYPFYDSNEYAISVLKEAEYTMAFVGESWTSDNLVKVGMNKYKLPRFVMVNYTTERDLKTYFGRIK